MQVERERQYQQQLAEVRGVIARYRGPLLESAIDLEQRLWHLIPDQCFQRCSAEELAEDIAYLIFTMAQVPRGGWW